MSNITILVANLTLLQKLSRGADVIEKQNGNTNVPGNEPLLAAFSATQQGLLDADAAVTAHKTKGQQLMSERDTALDAWMQAITALAAFTESATGGDPAKILSAGFGVKGQPSPEQPVDQVQNVRVTFNGEPGKSLVRWKRDSNADAYVIQCCQDPIVDSEWVYLATTPEPKFTGNGAIPGKRCWYRVAAVNRLGQGPWSEPALRPVM